MPLEQSCDQPRQFERALKQIGSSLDIGHGGFYVNFHATDYSIIPPVRAKYV